MKLIYILLIIGISSCTAYSQGWIRVVANSERYDGKEVSVSGWFEFKEKADDGRFFLWFSKEAYENQSHGAFMILDDTSFANYFGKISPKEADWSAWNGTNIMIHATYTDPIGKIPTTDNGLLSKPTVIGPLVGKQKGNGPQRHLKRSQGR